MHWHIPSTKTKKIWSQLPQWKSANLWRKTDRRWGNNYILPIINCKLLLIASFTRVPNSNITVGWKDLKKVLLRGFLKFNSYTHFSYSEKYMLHYFSTFFGPFGPFEWLCHHFAHSRHPADADVYSPILCPYRVQIMY